MNSYKYNYIEANPVRTFSDLNLAFTKHPLTGDVTKKTNEEAIKQSMKTLLLIGNNEKPFHPEVSGGIYDLLFENIDPDYEFLLEDRIKQVLRSHEPRIEVRKVDVKVSADQNGFNVSIYFVIINTLEPVTLNLFLKTVR